MGRRGCGKLLIGTLLVFVGSGCSLRIADLSAISTRNVNLDRVDIDRLEGRKVTGSDSGWVILFIPISFPHLEDAIDDALDQGEGDLLTDAVVHASNWWFLVGQQTLTVKGTAVKTRGTTGGGGQ